MYHLRQTCDDVYAASLREVHGEAMTPDQIAALARETAEKIVADMQEIRSACGFMWMRMAVVKDADDAYDVAKREFTEHEAAYARLEQSIPALQQALAEQAIESARHIAWKCRTCGCLWRDNFNNTVSLLNGQKSCADCELKPTTEACEPLDANALYQQPESLRIMHARKQEAANGFQAGWAAALKRVSEGDKPTWLAELVPEYDALVKLAEAESRLQALTEERDKAVERLTFELAILQSVGADGSAKGIEEVIAGLTRGPK